MANSLSFERKTRWTLPVFSELAYGGHTAAAERELALCPPGRLRWVPVVGRYRSWSESIYVSIEPTSRCRSDNVPDRLLDYLLRVVPGPRNCGTGPGRARFSPGAPRCRRLQGDHSAVLDSEEPAASNSVKPRKTRR